MHRGEIAIQGMLILSPGNNLLEHGKFHFIVGGGADPAVSGWPGVFIVEVIAGKAEHREFAVRIGAMQ